jgi:hypothetical protein
VLRQNFVLNRQEPTINLVEVGRRGVATACQIPALGNVRKLKICLHLFTLGQSHGSTGLFESDPNFAASIDVDESQHRRSTAVVDNGSSPVEDYSLELAGRLCGSGTLASHRIGASV